MPLYDFICSEGHTRERFFHKAEDATDAAPVCAPPCGKPMVKALSMGRGLTYFEEGRARTLYNLGDQPITVRSHEEHKRAMRDAKVDWATAGIGRKGCWT